MILEHVHIKIAAERRKAYLRDFNVAKSIIEKQSGCLSCRLLPELGSATNLLLLIEWEKKSDHTEGFRKSVAYLEWSRLLHPYYDDFPEVRYFEVT